MRLSQSFFALNSEFAALNENLLNANAAHCKRSLDFLTQRKVGIKLRIVAASWCGDF
jgi:hypothetical protein